jgi:hypothetical protein
VSVIRPAEAAQFLACLTGEDGWMSPCTFQTFPEAAGAPASLAMTLHGPLRRVVAELARRNARGAAIAVTVNETDGRGRRSEHIRALRSLFIDADAPLERDFALPPSLCVRTCHGQHAYWLLQAGEDVRRFRAAQRHLASYYDTDLAVSDTARAMRLPGFLHVKNEPFLVRLIDADSERRYGLDEVLAAHPRGETVGEGRYYNRRSACRPCAHLLYRRWARAAPLTVGSRNAVAFRLALEGVRAALDDEVVAAEVRSFCVRAGIADEAESVLRSARRAGG